MTPILSNEKLSKTVHRLRLVHPNIARRCRPGQFIILRVYENGERIPITIADSDPDSGTIDIVVQAVGKTTIELAAKVSGDNIQDVAGPLGVPTHVEKRKHLVLIGGGVGTATLLPLAKAHKKLGSTVTTVLGARNKDLIILQKELASFSDSMMITTDDGSYGIKGRVTDALLAILNDENNIDEVIAVGPIIMMKAVSEITKQYTIPTIVSLNPIMIDGTGMCGGCRVNVGGKVRFACVEGPEFDGHQVDFDTLMNRLRTYKDHEEHSCKLQKAEKNETNTG